MRKLVRHLIPNMIDKGLLRIIGARLAACLFVSSLAFCHSAHSQSIPASQNVYRSEIQLSQYNLIFTKVKINGSEALAMIDSGAYYTAQISLKLAHRLGIALSEDQTDRVRDINGKIIHPMAGSIASLSIGDYELRDLRVQVVEGQIERIANQVSTEFEVTLGWGMLSRSYLVVDYKRLRLMFSDNPIDLGQSQINIGYEVVNRVPTVRGAFSEDDVRLLFDTGAPRCSIDTEYAKVPAGEIIAKQLSLAGNKLPLEWRVRDLSAIRKSTGCLGVIGNNFLKSYAVYFDPKNKIIKLH
jgi:hypothetical protein